MHLGSIFRPEVLCPFDTAHIETAISPPSYLLVWRIIHFHHFKYHDPYNDSLMLTLCIHPWQLGGCGYRLPALSHCFTPFITYRAFRGRDITNGYDSVKTHFKQRPSGRTDVVFAHPLGMCHIIGLIGHLNHLSFLFNSGLDTSIIARKGDCAISTCYTTRIAGGFLFRMTPFFGTRKTPSHSTG